MVLSYGIGNSAFAQALATESKPEAASSAESAPVIDSEGLAARVTVHRDEWGLAHVVGEDDLADVLDSDSVIA